MSGKQKRTPEGITLSGGFTFLELLVVMSVIALITAAVVPVYSTAMTGLRSRNTKNDLVALIQYTQQQAIVEAREYRILFDDEDGRYWVTGWIATEGEEKRFKAVEADWGREKALPENLVFETLPKQKDDETKARFLAFYPNGACDQAEIEVEDTRDRRGNFSIETTGVLGKVEVKDSNAGRARIHIS